MTLLGKIRSVLGGPGIAGIVAGVLLAGPPAGAAAPPPQKKPPAAARPQEKSPPAFAAPTVLFPGGVRASGGLVYLTLPGFRPLTLDIYQPAPKKDAAPMPAIIYLHGGGWAGGTARESRAFSNLPGALADLAGHGYVVASVGYRLSGEARFPAALQDVKSAIRWLRAHAGDYGLDATRVMVWGEDAGGQLAALAGTSCGVSAFEPVADAGSKIALPSDCVEGVVDWYGPSDLATLQSDIGPTPPDTSELGAYLGCEPSQCEPGVLHAASALSYVGNMSPPFQIAQGARDTVNPPVQSQKLYDALRAAGVPAELALYPEAGHDFALSGSRGDSPAAKQAFARLVDFVSRTFPPAPPLAKAKAKAAAKKPARAPAKPAAGHKP